MIRRSARRGITLFEVVIALVIFILTLPALNTLVQIGTQRAEEAQMISMASLQCRSKLAEVMVGAEPLDSVSWSPLDNPNWTWRMEVSNGDVEGLKMVQVWARFEAGGTPIEATLSQMMIDPAVRGSTQDRALLDAGNAAMSSGAETGTEEGAAASSNSSSTAQSGAGATTNQGATGGAGTTNTSKSSGGMSQGKSLGGTKSGGTGGTRSGGGTTGGRTGGGTTGGGATGGRTGGAATGGSPMGTGGGTRAGGTKGGS